MEIETASTAGFGYTVMEAGIDQVFVDRNRFRIHFLQVGVDVAVRVYQDEAETLSILIVGRYIKTGGQQDRCSAIAAQIGDPPTDWLI